MKAFMGAVMAYLALLEAVFGVRTSEEPAFRSVFTEGAFEVRAYPELLVARTWSEGTADEASNRNFQVLAGYIFGKNRQKEKIGMTAPVYMPDSMKGQGEQIGMTAPVLVTQTDQKQEMIFVMPARYELSTLPQPEDERVQLGTISARTVATVRFSGRASDQLVAAKTMELLIWVDRQGYQVTSEPVPAFYDPPFTIPFLRRNEVHVEVERKN